MVNTSVSREAAEGIIPDELFERLQTFGFPEDRIYERDYFNPLKEILELDGVFDLEIRARKGSDALGQLEALFYTQWVENYQDQRENVDDWIEQASNWNPDSLEPGEEPIFAQIAFTAPLRLSSSTPIYTTLRYSRGENRYYRSDNDKRAKIEDIMRSNGFLE